MFNTTPKIMKRFISLPAIGILLSMLIASKICSAQTLFTVEVTGKGKPMILIHGLYGSKEIWKETVERYAKTNECHVLTLAGFGGNAPKLKENFLASVKDEVISYARDKKLRNSVIMGHSMGGYLALWAASSAPGLFDKVIAVDGVPFFAALHMPNATPESARPMAENMRKGMAAQTPEQIYTTQKTTYMPSMITDTAKINFASRLAMKADPSTQGQVMYEMYTTDLRDHVAKIDRPVLVMGAWIAYKNYGATHDSVKKAFTEQLKLVKNVKVEITDTAKHFIFYDDPQWFYNTVDSFLQQKI
jgi:pimeloyl-ACP methyl ester carboxylesterase